MSDRLPTIGGVVTKGECLTKILYHSEELENLYYTYAHLLNTEDNQIDKLLAKGWLGMGELMKLQRQKILEMAQGRLN